jgi:hypothetical protein
MRQNCVMAKDSAGATKTLALAQDERCEVGVVRRESVDWSPPGR